jgi:uncharacterized protein (DUF885 family)
VGVLALCAAACHAPASDTANAGAAASGVTSTKSDADAAANYAKVSRGFLDEALPDLSSDAITARAAACEKWLEQLLAIDREALTGPAHQDYRVLEYAMRARLLALRDVRRWELHPGDYLSPLLGGVGSLSDRSFAPLTERTDSMIARLGGAKALFAQARQNLEGVPKVYAELALDSARGGLRFLETSLPQALAAQGFADLPDEQQQAWTQARDAAVTELEAYRAWIEDEVLPNAEGEFRLGPELFRKKLLYEEHVDLSADELREINDAAIVRYQGWVEREAARIDPDAKPAEVMARVTADFPSPKELIPTARRYVEDARDFVVAHKLLTLPSDALPIVRPTPEYRRQGFASMSTPGPFETKATEAYYNITNVDPAWDRQRQEQHLTYFNHAGLLGISIHEAMPGHFVQLLYRQQIPTEVRQVFGPASLVEGWAHYVEQMMLDEGFGEGKPEIRLGQLRRALQRHARWHAGLSMHAFGATLDEAAKRFAEIAYFAPFPAQRETRRGTHNPTYLYYALGRMQILKLREDVEARRKAEGKPFSLAAFHDELLRLGLPLALAREVMLPGDGGPSI